jgi:hypothetical protein
MLRVLILLQYCRHSSMFYAGIKIFNFLPCRLESRMKGKTKNLRIQLNTHVSYCADQFLTFRNDSYCYFLPM